MAPLKGVFEGILSPRGILVFHKTRKSQSLMGQQDEENPTHLCSSLNLVSDCPKHYYKTFSAHHNGSEVPSTQDWILVKLVSITLGQKMRVSISEYSVAFHM